MKKSTYHIICAWALLLCFVTGQFMVYAHQHNQNKNIHASFLKHNCNTSSHVIVKEKCELCDSMHHNTMVLASNLQYQMVLITTEHFYKSPTYSFTSIALILAAGRAPPVVS